METGKGSWCREKSEAQFRAFVISQVFLTSVITGRSLCLHWRRVLLEIVCWEDLSASFTGHWGEGQIGRRNEEVFLFYLFFEKDKKISIN